MKKHIREVKVSDLYTHAVIPPVAAAALWVPFLLLKDKISFNLLYIYIPLALISYFLLRRFLIGLVLVYKAFAPMSVRSQCRFEPSCSTYMILSIKKYGIIYGVFKGICRIIRCRPPNGGVDYP